MVNLHCYIYLSTYVSGGSTTTRRTRTASRQTSTERQLNSGNERPCKFPGLTLRVYTYKRPPPSRHRNLRQSQLQHSPEYAGFLDSTINTCRYDMVIPAVNASFEHHMHGNEI